MPTKAEIEAELQASDTDRAIAKAREMLADWQEWEALLRAAERKVWQPHSRGTDDPRSRAGFSASWENIAGGLRKLRGDLRQVL